MGKESKTKIEDIQKKNNVFDWLKSNKDNLNIFFNFHSCNQDYQTREFTQTRENFIDSTRGLN